MVCIGGRLHDSPNSNPKSSRFESTRTVSLASAVPRVTLDTIVGAFSDGATAEEIAQQYPSVKLADVYYVIGYYLRSRSEVEAYLRERQSSSQIVREENEARFDPQGIRDRLLARRASGEQ